MLIEVYAIDTQRRGGAVDRAFERGAILFLIRRFEPQWSQSNGHFGTLIVSVGYTSAT